MQKRAPFRPSITLLVAIAVCSLLLAQNVWLTVQLHNHKAEDRQAREEHRPAPRSYVPPSHEAAGAEQQWTELPPSSFPHSLGESVTELPARGLGAGPVWLLVLVPTIGRRKDYLLPTLKSIVKQIPTNPHDPLTGAVHVRVVNNDKGVHEALQGAKRAFGGLPFVHFVDGNTDGGLRWGSMGVVERQSQDLVAMLQGVNPTHAHHVMVIEDDQMLCPNALLALQYLIRKAYAYAPGWLALRTSVGFNGLVLPAPDAPSLATYIQRHKGRRPPDHLFSEWIQRPDTQSGHIRGRDSDAAGRPFFAFRHNVLYHVGDASTVGHEARKIAPKCYDTLQDWLQAVEMFHIDECPHDDVWPCPGGKGQGELRYHHSDSVPVSSQVEMVDWTGARLCQVPCGNPLGFMNLDGSPAKPLTNERSLKRCQQLQQAHQVHVGASWGTLPEMGKKEWMDLDCDRAFGR